MFVTIPGSSGRRGPLDLYLLFLMTLLLSSCATRPYVGVDVDSAIFLDRAVSKEAGQLQVSASVATAEETIALTGLDLYEQGIQPVWLSVKNHGETKARIATWSVDRDYFSPIEVAYMNRKKFSKEGYRELERWFHENGLPRFVPPGEARSGLVFTHLRPGTKGFNLTVFQDNSANDFTFFLPLPGFVPDFMEVDFDNLYSESDFRDVDQAGLQEVLESELGCCSMDVSGELEGAPLNVVLVGTGTAVRRAMLRGGWLETSSDQALHARQQHFAGRTPDAIFMNVRKDGNERIHIDLWMAPWRVDSEPVWVGQVYYLTDEKSTLGWIDPKTVQDSELLSFIVGESVTADPDSAQRFLFQNLWYNGSLKYAGFADGVGAATMEEPRTGFGRIAYFTDGTRLVVFLSEDPMALDEGRFIYKKRAEMTGRSEKLPFNGKEVPPPNDRRHVQTDGSLVVTAAVPSAEESREIFDLNLYSKNVQPVWIQVENRGDRTLYLTPMGIDPGYFTARETANRSRSRAMERHTQKYEERGHVTMTVAAHSTQSGYVFTRVDEGTKSFNVDVIGDGQAHLLNFAVPVPGLKLDHYEIDIEGLYDDSELIHADLPQLVAKLEAMPCCVRDARGQGKGDPLNLVFIGEIQDMYYAFMRAGWDETETIYGSSLWKTMKSSVGGSSYRYSPVSALYVFDRPQDAALQRARSSINERNHLRIWLTPLRYEGTPVWIGQISRDIGVHFTRKTITTHKIDPDVDETREYLLEDLAFSQALKRFAYVGGTGAAIYDDPRGNLSGDPYFTDGRRVIMWISGEPNGLDEIEALDLSPYHTGVIGD
ncbi:MAG: LssY C-terminal domain-containing protein [Gammaproteobacteria bacterium]